MPHPLAQRIHMALRWRIRKTIRTKPFDYQIGAVTISLPPEHRLPEFQTVARLYDRFLPVLASHIPHSGIVVDVGANVGDTVAAILQSCPNSIIAIEGHDRYFSLLQHNLTRIGACQRVTPIKALVGTGALNGSLVAQNGTARLHVNGHRTRVMPLDALLADADQPITLLKVDTDGFDADVIMSGLDTIRRDKPILFWEGGTTDTSSFTKMYEALADIGYKRTAAFDNTGNLLISEMPIETLPDLDRYVSAQWNFNCSRTIPYFDILSWTENDRCVCAAALDVYRRLHIEAHDSVGPLANVGNDSPV